MSDSDFNTPPWFLELVRQLSINRDIGLDPCSNGHSMTNARLEMVLSKDALTNHRRQLGSGLEIPWRGHGLVFMNPPHSMSPHNIEPWIDKALDEFESPSQFHDNPRDSFVGLVPAKTGPQWFHDIAPTCMGRCFMKGRIKFWHEGMETTGPGKFDSLVLYIGPNFGQFYNLFSPYGWVV